MSASRQLQSSRSQNMLACLFLEIQYIQRWILSKFRLGECLLTTVAGRGDNRQWITNHPSRQSWICKNFCNIYLIFLYLVFLLHDSINSEQWIATYQKYQYCGSCAFSLSFWCQSLQVHICYLCCQCMIPSLTTNCISEWLKTEVCQGGSTTTSDPPPQSTTDRSIVHLYFCILYFCIFVGGPIPRPPAVIHHHNRSEGEFARVHICQQKCTRVNFHHNFPPAPS